MRILATADSHLGITSGRTPSSRSQFRQLVFNQFFSTARAAVKLQADVFLHAGDIFNRSQPPKWAITQYFTVIEYLLNQDISVLVTPGNHDRAELTTSLYEYYYPHYTVFNSLGSCMIDRVSFIGFPFEYISPRLLFSRATKLTDGNPTILFCHQLFYGATFGPHNFTFSHQPEVIHSQIPANIQVISGHIHRAQQLSRGQIVYPGSTVRSSFAEVIEPKGYLVVDIEDSHMRIEFHELSPMNMEVVEIEGIDMIKLEEIKPTEDRLLLRFLNTPLTKSTIASLYQYFPPEEYPFLSISPRTEDRMLKKLYSISKYDFAFEQIDRDW